jgi:hypothetical protein
MGQYVALKAPEYKGFSDFNGLKEVGWGTWIRTKIDGVRVRSSTVELFPNAAGADWRAASPDRWHRGKASL